MKEAFLGGERLPLVNRGAVVGARFQFAAQRPHRVALEQRQKLLCIAVAEMLANPDIEHGLVGRNRLRKAAVQLLGLLQFGIGGIRDMHQFVHLRGGGEQSGERPAEQVGFQLGLHLGNTRADQRIAPLEMVVEEGERRTDGEGVQPQREPRQFHRQVVQVYAIDTALHHHPAQQAAVGQLLIADKLRVDALLAHARLDRLADAAQLWIERVVVTILLQHSDYLVAEVVHRADQEMARPHRRVEDFQVEQRLAGRTLQLLHLVAQMFDDGAAAGAF